MSIFSLVLRLVSSAGPFITDHLKESFSDKKKRVIIIILDYLLNLAKYHWGNQYYSQTLKKM